eukprot:12356258-Prorocentrum_lima.AAC.1
MLGEVRVRSDEERTARASGEASARLSPSYPAVAGAIAGPTSKGKGKRNMFKTHEGRLLGRT